MEKIIKMGCPVCGTVQLVKYVPGCENGIVPCRVCNKRYAFAKFKWIDNTANEETLYPGSGNAKPKENTERTRLGAVNNTIGHLIAAGRIYPLRLGKNVIGRKAESSSATIQLPTNSMRLCREHIIIEVKNIPGMGSVHHGSLYKKAVNATFVNNSQLEFGDVLVLNNHNIIRLPDVNVEFEIPENDKTIMD
ncbi:MAG: FHA domain-containing protein [Bacteroidaceae bacterium]|nr:FHA domain-containing protein [Bacteroidaceae bacterium]